MKKKRYVKPQTIMIQCTTNNICNTSSYYNDEPPVTENIGAKENGDVWDEGWDEDEENNNLLYSSLWD